MTPQRKSLYEAIHVTVTYWYTLTLYIFYKQKYINCSTFPQDIHAKVQIYSLSLIFSLWNQSHYRSQSFQQDMIDNLRNVAIPGTGLPLSFFVCNYWICLFFIYFMNPFICLFGAFNKLRIRRESNSLFCSSTPLQEQVEIVCCDYIDHLIHPTDWFSFWRLNCRLASLHSLITQSSDYQMEDKWTFLLEGEKCGAAVSPFMTNIETIVCKNKNIEGGMGIHFFTNAAKGGDWIIQEKMSNADWLNQLLPSNPPLSTMRILTCSTWYLEVEKGNVENEEKERENLDNCSKYITALSSVLRLGRANASTDHTSVLFDVDLKTGVIQGGMSNAQWYQLGLSKILTCPWLPPDVEAQCKNGSSKSAG